MIKIRGTKDVLDYINEHGFVLYTKVKNVKIKNLWDVTENPSWDITLGKWLDQIIKEKTAVYPLLIKNRTGIVSREFFPYLYRLKSRSINLLDKTPEEYYYAGELKMECKKILEALESGPKGVGELREISNTTGKEGKAVFDKVMTELKQAFTIVKIDVRNKGWGENVFALTCSEFRKEVEEAEMLDIEEAYQFVLLKYLNLYGEINDVVFAQLFRLNANEVKTVFENLYQKNIVSMTLNGTKKMYCLV